MKPYVGICKGGPWAGEVLAHGDPRKRVAFMPHIPRIPTSAAVTDPGDVKVGEYRFDKDRKEWDWLI